MLVGGKILGEQPCMIVGKSKNGQHPHSRIQDEHRHGPRDLHPSIIVDCGNHPRSPCDHMCVDQSNEPFVVVLSQCIAYEWTIRNNEHKEGGRKKTEKCKITVTAIRTVAYSPEMVELYDIVNWMNAKNHRHTP